MSLSFVQVLASCAALESRVADLERENRRLCELAASGSESRSLVRRLNCSCAQWLPSIAQSRYAPVHA